VKCGKEYSKLLFERIILIVIGKVWAVTIISPFDSNYLKSNM